MHERRIPEWLRHAPTPGVRGFATLAGLEAIARGILISVFPLILYRALGDAGLVSAAYFWMGILSLIAGLLVPWITRVLPRRWVYSTGTLVFAAGAALAFLGGPLAVLAALGLTMVATVVLFVCFNAYVLDYIARTELGRCETSRMFYSALGWTFGPVAGVTLMQLWPPAPFLISVGAMLAMLAVFWFLRLGNGKLITRSRTPPANPLAYLPRFLAQPRLIVGWFFAVIRSCGWWVYVVYLPIFAIENGLGEELGGTVLSVTNACLFLSPFVLRWVQARSLRSSVRIGFAFAAFFFGAAGIAAGWPVLAVVLLMAGSLWLIVLDICGGLPFLMAVKPSERTEMSAIYSSYRDVSGILTPGAAWAILLVTPVSGTFIAAGLALLGAWSMAAHLHPRLGQARITAEPLQPRHVAAASMQKISQDAL